MNHKTVPHERKKIKVMEQLTFPDRYSLTDHNLRQIF